MSWRVGRSSCCPWNGWQPSWTSTSWKSLVMKSTPDPGHRASGVRSRRYFEPFPDSEGRVLDPWWQLLKLLSLNITVQRFNSFVPLDQLWEKQSACGWPAGQQSAGPNLPRIPGFWVDWLLTNSSLVSDPILLSRILQNSITWKKLLGSRKEE